MQQSFRRIKCQNGHTATTACLTHDCQASSTFQCSTSPCTCCNLHHRCKIMKLSAVEDYLAHWEKWIGKESQQFMNRVMKMYATARDKLQREEEIFLNYCRTMFLGKEHAKVVSLIERQEYRAISSQLLSASLSRITESTTFHKFDPFTQSQMRRIDDRIRSLTDQIELIYKSKERKKAEAEKLARSYSVTLQKSTISTKSQLPERSMIKSSLQMEFPFAQFIKIKTDLTFPKTINSKIIHQATLLNRLIGKKVKKYHLTYRASESSFSIGQFYRKHNVIYDSLRANIAKNDLKQELFSIIIVKTEFGKVIGGITALRWDQKPAKYEIDSDEDSHNPQASKSCKYKQDTSSSTNLFSLDLMQRYDLLKPDQAIYCGRTSIGFGKRDLRIIQSSQTTRKNSCKFPSSFQLAPNPYPQISKSGMTLSGSKYSPFFKLEEWQSFILQV